MLTGPFGSGKLVACCVEIMKRAYEQSPGPDGVRRTRWAVIRNTYPDLKTTTVKTWRAWIDDEWGQFNQSPPFTHRIQRRQLKDGTKLDCEVIFLAMDDESDVKKFLSLEVTGIWFNECRELRKDIIDAGDGRIGRYPAMKDGGPTWYGMIADTNKPDEDHWIYNLDKVQRSDAWEFFDQPGGLIKTDAGWVQNPLAENIKNLPKDYYIKAMEDKPEEWISVYLGAQYGMLPTEGAYYHDEMREAENTGRIGSFPINPEMPVHTFWDLGISDDMCIWMGQAFGDQWKWVSFYENRGQSLDFYAGYLSDMKAKHRLNYGNHVWPHDGSNRDPGILGGKTRKEVFEGLGYSPLIMPRHHLGDGIDATRRLIRISSFDAAGCKDGLVHLRKYKRQFNAARNVFNDQPLHDEHSHGADAFRCAGMGRSQVTNDHFVIPVQSMKWVA